MKAAEPYSRTIRFGDFEVDLHAGELHKHGVRIRLQDQPLKILTTLVERAGDVVSREEFRQALWPADTFVDFDHGLSAAVNKLREALCDSADHPGTLRRFRGAVTDSSPKWMDLQHRQALGSRRRNLRRGDARRRCYGRPGSWDWGSRRSRSQPWG